jgi:hypothetical protein
MILVARFFLQLNNYTMPVLPEDLPKELSKKQDVEKDFN